MNHQPSTIEWLKKIRMQGCILLGLVMGVQGCASVPVVTQGDWRRAHALAEARPTHPKLKAYYARLEAEGERNRTLNLMRLARRAMLESQWDDAKRALDECIVRIEALSSAEPGVEAAKSTFEQEALKPFKGEPYERAMTYLYRGLLYYQDGEFDNAMACCKNVQLQDQGGQGYSADFATAEFLTAASLTKMGRHSEARDVMARLGRARLPDGWDVLLVAESGQSPIKRAEGNYGEKLFYSETPDSVGSVRLKVDGREAVQAVVSDDLFFQATTRGGRRIDELLEEKAAFKQTTGTAGDVLTVGGAAAAILGSRGRNDGVALAGLGALGAGLASKGLSASAEPQADTRYWDTLPHTIWLAVADIPESTIGGELEYSDRQNVIITRKRVQIQPDATVVWAGGTP